MGFKESVLEKMRKVLSQMNGDEFFDTRMGLRKGIEIVELTNEKNPYEVAFGVISEYLNEMGNEDAVKFDSFTEWLNAKTRK